MTSQTPSRAQFGGTRHLAGAQFVYHQRDAIALVASQDTRFTVFADSSSEEIVHADRIDLRCYTVLKESRASIVCSAFATLRN